MLVKELIAQLETQPQDLPVGFASWTGCEGEVRGAGLVSADQNWFTGIDGDVVVVG